MTTVNDFVDILRIIREQPEWGEALRSALLSKEVLELPQRLAEFSEAANKRFDRLEGDVTELKDGQARLEKGQARLEGDVAELKGGQARLEGDVAELKEGQARLEGRVERLEEGQVRLEEGQARLEGDVSELKGEVSQLKGDVGNIKGATYEQKVVSNIATYLRHPLGILRVRVLKALGVSDNTAFYDALDAAEGRGLITSRERTEAGSTDIVVRGRRDSEPSTLFVAVEVSVTAGDSDINRARERADILHRATEETAYPAVVCAHADEGRRSLAIERNVTLVVVSE